MPIAVVMEAPEHFDLKTLPEGFVEIRRMSNGEKMQRRSFNSKMTMKARKGQKDVNTEMDMFNERSELWDWAKCIVNHNLQDADGRLLNFTNPEDVRKMDGRVAEEIGTYIDRVNNFEDDEEVGK